MHACMHACILSRLERKVLMPQRLTLLCGTRTDMAADATGAAFGVHASADGVAGDAAGAGAAIGTGAGLLATLTTALTTYSSLMLVFLVSLLYLLLMPPLLYMFNMNAICNTIITATLTTRLLLLLPYNTIVHNIPLAQPMLLQFFLALLLLLLFF